MASSSSPSGNPSSFGGQTGVPPRNLQHDRTPLDPTMTNTPGFLPGRFHPRYGMHGAAGNPDHNRSFSELSRTDPVPPFYPSALTGPVNAIPVYPNGQFATAVPVPVIPAVNNDWNLAATPFVPCTQTLHAPVNNTDWGHQTIEEFKFYFGNNAENLWAWQRICWHCAVPEGQVPSTIAGCRAVSHPSQSTQLLTSLLLPRD